MGKLYNKYGEVVGSTGEGNPDRTDRSEGATNATVGGNYVSQGSTPKPSSGFGTGTTGFAKQFSDAYNAGKSYDDSINYATTQTGGSGLRRPDIDQILYGTGTSSQSQGVTYDPITGYAIGSGSKKKSGSSTPEIPGVPNTSMDSLLKALGSSGGGNNFPYENFLNDLMGSSSYTPLTDEEMLSQAQQYANLQIDPLLTAIQNNLGTSVAAKEGSIGEIEAAYAGIPGKIQAMINEARNYATEDAIARGMGRSGVVNWETEKRTTPLMQQQADAEREKSAKLASVQREIEALRTAAANSTAEAEARRGTLEANQLANLRNLGAQLAIQSDAAKWGQGYNLAQLANTANQSNVNNLLGLLPYFMYG